MRSAMSGSITRSSGTWRGRSGSPSWLSTPAPITWIALSSGHWRGRRARVEVGLVEKHWFKSRSRGAWLGWGRKVRAAERWPQRPEAAAQPTWACTQRPAHLLPQLRVSAPHHCKLGAGNVRGAGVLGPQPHLQPRRLQRVRPLRPAGVGCGAGRAGAGWAGQAEERARSERGCPLCKPRCAHAAASYASLPLTAVRHHHQAVTEARVRLHRRNLRAAQHSTAWGSPQPRFPRCHTTHSLPPAPLPALGSILCLPPSLLHVIRSLQPHLWLLLPHPPPLSPRSRRRPVHSPALLPPRLRLGQAVQPSHAGPAQQAEASLQGLQGAHPWCCKGRIQTGGVSKFW